MYSDYSVFPTLFEMGEAPSKEKIDLLNLPAVSAYGATLGLATYAADNQSARASELKRLGAEKFKAKYGYEITPTGQILYSGTASPLIITGGPGSTQSALNLALLLTGGKAVYGIATRTFKPAAKSLARTAGIGLSKPITKTSQNFIDLLIPPKPTGWKSSGAPRQLGRLGVTLAGFELVPGLAIAYGTEFVKSVAASPKEAWKDIKKYQKEYPYEFYGMLAYGTRRV
jgi:hypothetical protein